MLGGHSLSVELIGKKVRWGGYKLGIIPNLYVRHLAFASEKGVSRPAFGQFYAGMGVEGSDCS